MLFACIQCRDFVVTAGKLRCDYVAFMSFCPFSFRRFPKVKSRAPFRLRHSERVSEGHASSTEGSKRKTRLLRDSGDALPVES